MRLELREISKQFPGVLANDRVSIGVDRGEILGMLGENGAGKTTLMNILSGLIRPDSGEILIEGSVRTFRDPSEAIDAGIGMVHQHFMLVPVFNVTDAVSLGSESTTGPLRILDRAAARARVLDVSERHGLKIDPDAIIEDLPVGVRQRVEILKMLYRKSDILILDEPSAVLTPQETEELFGIMRGLARAGTSIIFITHKLQEVLDVADRITVLRRGRVAGTVRPSETDLHGLAEMMVGRDVQLVVPRGDARPGAPVLEIDGALVRDDRGEMAVKGADLVVRQGEIVAIAGVQGNGQTELVEAITGLRPLESGEIRIGGVAIKPDPRAVADLGVCHIPEDRLAEGLVRGLSLAENYVLDSYHRPQYGTWYNLSPAKIDAAAEQGVRDFDVRTPSVDIDVAHLSGGNQQKLIVAREFSRTVKLVVGAQPTRGLDVGSIEYIHRRIVEQRDAGAAVLIVSTELEEVQALADRIAVMYNGRIAGILSADEATPERLGLLMGGAA